MRTPARLLVVSAIAFCVFMAAAPDPSPDDAPGRLSARLGARRAAERDAAADLLADLGADAVPALERGLASDDAEVRARSRMLLARLRPGADDAAADRRRAAAEIWVRRSLLDGATLAPGTALDDRLADLAPESSDVLAGAMVALSRDRIIDEPLAAALVRRPTPAVCDALVTLWLEDAITASAGLRAAWALEETYAPDASPSSQVDKLTTTPAAAPRRRMRVALIAALEGARARDFLAVAAEDPDAGVRAEAARALGRHCAASMAPLLRRLAADPSPDVRVAALAALLAVPGGPHPEPAVAASSDPLPRVRRAAAELLAREATPAEIPVLARLAADPSVSVRASARGALRRLGIATTTNR